DSPDGGTRGLAVWAGAWTPADVPRLAALVDDRAIEVRSRAVLALRELGARTVAPRLAARLSRETDLGDPRAPARLGPALSLTTKPSRWEAGGGGRGHVKTFGELAKPAYERCRRVTGQDR